MHLGNQRKPAEHTMDNIMLSTTTVEKDLGVYIDSDLKFRRHVAQIVLKANQILGLIKVTFTCLDKCTLPRLFTALVCPHLEYGNTIWNPRFKLDEQAEKVQRRATKLVPSIRDLPCTERLRQLA